jgi:hypothetical protein
MIGKNELQIPNRDEQYINLIDKISEVTSHARGKIAKSINTELIGTYWLIGQYIVEFEQDGKANSTYGSKLGSVFPLFLELRYYHRLWNAWAFDFRINGGVPTS